MCSDLPSLIDAMRWATFPNAWQSDFEVVDLPWSEEKLSSARNRLCQPGQSNGSLVFGIMHSDDEVLPHPPVQRAMMMVSNALKQCGYEVSRTIKVAALVELTPLGH